MTKEEMTKTKAGVVVAKDCTANYQLPTDNYQLFPIN
jgi:hypothetical protein